MATASTLRKLPLLDLSFLTAEERAKLESVVRADQNLLVQDRVRVGTLRQELEKERYFQKQLLDKPQCSCCELTLGRLFNSGAPCPNCLYRVCKTCRVLSENPPPPFLCPVCAKKRLLDIQAADYVSLPTSDFSPCPLFGSHLVMMSLDALETTAEPTMVNPYDGKARRRLNSSLSRASSTDFKPRSGTNDSSIVVRYASISEREEGVANGRGHGTLSGRSESVMSGSSDTGSLASRRERPTSLPARRVSPGDYSDSEEEDEKNKLEIPGLSKLKHSESISSIGSLTSMYSAVGGKGDYAISGEIRFGVWYSRDGLLKVHVDQARNLAAARKEGYSYPYVKVYLLPDKSKHTKRKTGFIRRTVSPKYDETFKYKLAESELSSRTVWLSVWDWDRFGRNQFLGEVKLPLTSLDLTNDTDRWYTLLDQDESAQQEMEGQYRGRLLLGLMFELNEEPLLPPGKNRKSPRRKGVLLVAIRRAEDLPKMDAGGLTNAVVKCYLLPSRTSSNKRKTQVVMNSVSPVWDEEFVYKISERELTRERVLEITVWDYDKRGSNDFIGGLRVGPARSGSASQGPDWMDSFGEEVSHWQTVLSRPGEWVEQWHTLRPRMDRAITSLPEKPKTPHSSRERSPVQEKLSPPLEEEEEEEEAEEREAKSLSGSPVVSIPQVTGGEKKTVVGEVGGGSGKANTLPSRDPPTGRKPSPLMQSKRKHNEVVTGGVDPVTTGSKSPSPIPRLLVTSESSDKQAGPAPTAAGLTHSTSSSSIHSTALSEGELGRGDYEITGDLQLCFIYRLGKLSIHVDRARGLAAADSNGFSDPYVKTYLLPDRSKSSKRKTGVQRKTLSPIFNETLEYSVAESELSSRTVWLSVWDWDRFGRNQFLGEVKLPMTSLDLRSETKLWYPLVDKDQPYNLNPSSSQLLLSLRFTPRGSEGGVTRGALSVDVKRARNLFPSTEDSDALSRSYITCALLPDNSRRKTTTVEGSSDHSWRESFVFEGVTVEEMAKERVLEVSAWDSSRGDYFIGGLRTGPSPDGTSRNREWMDSVGDEVSHWETVLARPGEWAEQWHTLQKNMTPTSPENLDHAPRTGALTDEFRKVVPSSASKTAAPKWEDAAKEGKSNQAKTDKSRATADEFRKTGPRETKPTTATATLDEEFRKVKPNSSSVSPHESPSLGNKMTSLAKPPEDRLRGSGSHSSLPRSVPPLTLEEIARSDDALRPRSVSPHLPPSSNVVTPGSTLERSTNQMMPMGPRKRAGLLGLSDGGSRSSLGSQLSIYSSAGGGKGNYDITGEILLGISYGRDRTLSIHVDRARGLAAADSNGFSDPYIKTYLLPDRSKSSKRKTGVQRKTLNPVYDQTLKYIVAPSELDSQTLWLSVWDWDRFGRNQFLGEVRLALASLDLSDGSDRWHTLQDRDEDTGTADYYRGQLNLALRYSPSGTKKGKTRGSLDVVIKRGRDFPSMGGNTKPDPVVKCYLLPDKTSSGKRKVGVIKNRSDPVWEEMVTYEKIVLEELAKERVLEVTVWDWDKKGSTFIGGLRIGPAPDGTSQNREWKDSIGDEVIHWETVLARPGEWAEKWHTLRTTMDPRSVSIQ